MKTHKIINNIAGLKTADNYKSSPPGFTLIELLIVSLVSLVLFIAFSMAISASLELNESSENSVAALIDAAAVIERMRMIDPLNAANLTTVFPDNGLVAGFDNLSGQTVRVNYADLSADPIQVTVTVTWLVKTRTRTESLTTLLTRR